MKHLFYMALFCSSATQFAMLAPLRTAFIQTARATASQQARAFNFCSDECTRDKPTEFGKGWSGCKKRNKNRLTIGTLIASLHAQQEKDNNYEEDQEIVDRISTDMHDPNFVCRDTLPTFLEDACHRHLPKTARVLLSAAKKHGIDITDSAALHYAQTEPVAEMLIEHGMQVNRIPTHAYTTPLHVSNLIPFLLRNGADAQLEMKDNPFLRLIRWYPVGDGTDLARGEIFGIEEMAAAFKGTIPRENLCAEMDKHFTVSWISDKKESWHDFDLRLTPPALAVKDGDLSRTKEFLKHASPEALMPQLDKLHFLARIMGAWEPSKKWSYIYLRIILDDYKHGGPMANDPRYLTRRISRDEQK